MRRPGQLRLAGFLAGLSAVAFALAITFAVDLLLGRRGRLGFDETNAIGLLEGAVFVLALFTALRYLRSALRLPSPTLLSLGLITPPPARRVAQRVPVVDAAQGIQSLAANRIVIVQEHGVPVGVTGVRRENITPWDDLVKVGGDIAVTDLRRLLAHERVVIVMDGGEVAGVVTQEMYLGGLWGSVR